VYVQRYIHIDECWRGYGNVVTMSPQYEYRSFPFISQQNKVYIAKQLQHRIG